MSKEKKTHIAKSYPRNPEFTGHTPEVLVQPPPVFLLPEAPQNRALLPQDHQTIQDLRAAGDNRNIAVIIPEPQYLHTIDSINQQLTPIIQQSKLPLFFAYIAYGGKMLHWELNQKNPLIPPPQNYHTGYVNPNAKSGFIRIKGSAPTGDKLTDSREKILDYNRYNLFQKHLVIIDDGFDTNGTIQTSLTDAAKNKVARITTVLLLNKIDSETTIKSKDYEPKVIIDSGNIPLSLIIGASVSRSNWIGGGGFDYIKTENGKRIGENDRVIGALVN